MRRSPPGSRRSRPAATWAARSASRPPTTASQLTALRPALEYPATYEGIEGMRIAYKPDQGWARIDPDVRRNTEAALDVLRGQGAGVEEVELPWTSDGIRDATTKALLSSAMGALLIGIKAQNRPDDLTSYASFFVELAGNEGGPVQLAEAQEVAAQMHAEYDALFEQGFDAFICPSVSTGEVPADFDFTSTKLLIDGEEVDPLAGPMLTPAFNLVYTIPVVAVPTGVDRNNVPSGMQVCSRAFDDLTAFRVAAAYEAAAPRFFEGDLMPDFRGAASQD